MSGLGNLWWLLAGGLVTGILWFVAGIIMFCTVIGIPWARACMVMGNLALFPFGREAISRRTLTGRGDIGTGGLGCLGNVVWFVFGGFWLAISHTAAAILCAITIIGIPFAIQHLKLGGLAINPIGKTIVTKHVARAARDAEAEEYVARYRS